MMIRIPDITVTDEEKKRGKSGRFGGGLSEEDKLMIKEKESDQT